MSFTAQFLSSREERTKLWRVMKLTAFLFFAACITASATGFTQVVTLSEKEARLEKIFKAIKKQTGYVFFYDETWMKKAKKVNINVVNTPLEEVLNRCFKDQPLTYSIVGTTIVLKQVNVALPTINEFKIQLPPPPFIVTGKIIDGEGNPLDGVSVLLKSTKNGVSTAKDGTFSIQVPEGGDVLIFSYVGFENTEMKISKPGALNITLRQLLVKAEEVVVVGYGTVKKSDLTGSVSSVKTSELQKTPMASIDQALVGRAAGVQVTQTSGMPGAVASIRVRGSSSIQGGNEPLYVIDGFPIYSGTGFGNTGGSAQLSGLSTVNPNDIESIEILKDAAATAIYGARAANGVVLITTKTGKKGRDIVSFEASYGIQNVANKLDLMDAQQYAALVNEAYTNDNLTAPYDAAKLTEIAKLGSGTDWQDEIFRKGSTQNYQLTLSGGDDKNTYSVSGNYFDQKGIIINSDFKRYSTRLNFDRKMSDKFKIGTNFSLSHTLNNAVATDVGGLTGVVFGALGMNPILPVYKDVASQTYTEMNNPGILLPNPVASANEQIFNNATSRLLANIYGEWKIKEGLVAKVTLGADVIYDKSNQYTPSTIVESMGRSTARVGVNRSINWLNENTINWTKTYNKIHSFNVLGGFTLQQSNFENVLASSSGFVNDVLTYNNLSSGSIYNQPGSSATQWNLMSYLARINYTLMNRYLFSLNSRIDGSSRFGANNKYGYFPSGAAAWRVSEEKFMRSLKNTITNLKLRGSYGFTGNTEIGVYESLATLGNTNWIIGRQLVTGFFPNKIPNPDLRWERTSQLDVGLDLGLFKNRIRLTADYYRKETTDLIYNVSVPSASGYQTMLKNIGSVENKGLEFSIESDNITGNFRWNTSFNISFNRNKVLELGGEPYKEIPDASYLGSFRRLVVGEPLGVFYGYRFDGIFQNTSETAAQISSASPIGVGLRRYKDLNGDKKVVAANDREILGDANPDFFGGLANSFTYKGLELNVFFLYSYGNKIFNYNAIDLETPTAGQNAYADVVNRWTPTNPSNTIPKANTNRTVVVSDRWVEDGSFLRLKTLSLSYNFPNLKLMKSTHRLMVYLTGQNLLTWTNYRGYDPEVSFRGASTLQAGEDNAGYPQSKTYMVGVKLDF